MHGSSALESDTDDFCKFCDGFVHIYRYTYVNLVPIILNGHYISSCDKSIYMPSLPHFNIVNHWSFKYNNTFFIFQSDKLRVIVVSKSY